MVLEFENGARAVESVTIGGFDTCRLSRARLANLMVRDVLAARSADRQPAPRLVFSSNGQGIALAGKDPEFNRIMRRADIIHADGMPVVLASKFTRAPLPERIATTDFFHDAAVAAAANGVRFYFLGASEAENKRAVERVRILYPTLEVAGRHHGYFREEDSEAVIEDIRERRTDVLWVALGKPRQEAWCVAHRDELRGVAWLKTCGGLYSFLAGTAPRAPVWMQHAGLEWVYRTFHEPKRLLWRYLSTNPYALWRLATRTNWTAPATVGHLHPDNDEDVQA